MLNVNSLDGNTRTFVSSKTILVIPKSINVLNLNEKTFHDVKKVFIYTN